MERDSAADCHQNPLQPAAVFPRLHRECGDKSEAGRYPTNLVRPGQWCPEQKCSLLGILQKKADGLSDGKTTQVDLNSPIAKGTDHSQPPAGTVPDATTTTLDSNAVTTILKYNWDNSTLALLTQMKQWSLQQLEAAVNQQTATTNQPPTGQVFAFRQQAAGFGFNLPARSRSRSSRRLRDPGMACPDFLGTSTWMPCILRRCPIAGLCCATAAGTARSCR